MKPLELIAPFMDTLLPRLQSVAPQASGIMPSEMLLFCGLCMAQGVTRVVESGRKNGYSTACLAACLPDVATVSVEQSPVAEADARLKAAYPGIVLLHGDGAQVVQRWVNAAPFARFAILLDGPKGHNALNLFGSVQGRVAFAAVHDLCAANEARLSDAGRDGWYSDDPEWTAAVEHLDEFWWRNGGYRSRAEMTRDSFTLGVFTGGQWR